ncbi:SDR family NAD(P)-dependent oxidoreductase, partial [Klebsiella pneumoniae]|uniref:SDR family NAD(P)-dependent oxidoreductase n=1 Tax=Klebsiella pneumoniae TaxID=573 RepID=UPI002D1E8E0B
MARVVVITGGGTGIGAACPRLMRAAGDRVFITGRREAPLQAVADETGATALVGDAADGEVWRQRLLPAILDQTGGVDVLLCRAGGGGENPPPRDSHPPRGGGAGGELNPSLFNISRPPRKGEKSVGGLFFEKKKKSKEEKPRG